MDFEKLPKEKKQYYFEQAEIILDGLLYCTRVWDAWGQGTMNENDFIPADKDDNIIIYTAEKLYIIVESGLEDIRKYEFRDGFKSGVEATGNDIDDYKYWTE